MLKNIYDILSLVQMMILRPGILDSASSSVGWITFHQKALRLGIKFPLYPFIKKFGKDPACTRTIDAKWVVLLVLSHPYIERAQSRV